MRVGIFDIETNGLLPECDTIWCAVVKDWPNGEHRAYTPANIHDLPSVLDEYDVLVGHNIIKFDLPVIRKVFGYTSKARKVDTLLISRHQRPRRHANSLEWWGKKLRNYKVEHEDWTQFSLKMLKRCHVDVDITEDVLNYLVEEGKGENWDAAHKLNAQIFELLELQENRGWYVDRQHMQRCVDTLHRWMQRLEAATLPRLPLVVEDKGTVNKPFKKDGTYARITCDWYSADESLHNVGGKFTRVQFRPVSLDKNKEVKNFLLSQGWNPAEWNYDGQGQRSSPKLSKDDPFHGVEGGLGTCIVRYLQCKQRAGTIDGWLGSIRPDGRIPTPVSGLAATGRLRHKGVVNVPGNDAFFGKWMRRCFTATPGYRMVGVDSKGNQIRQLAARMDDPEFTAAVLEGDSSNGTDIHSVNAKKSGAPSRKIAKNFFYGFIFGAGDSKIASQIGSTKAKAKEIKENYIANMPKLKALIKEYTDQWRATAQVYYDKKRGEVVHKNGWIRGLDGRPIQVDSEHKVLCYLLQSDEAIHMGLAYVLLHQDLETLGLHYGEDWGMLIWYHDEFQMECKPEFTGLLSKVGSDAIRDAGEMLGIVIPHEGDAKVGENWYATH